MRKDVIKVIDILKEVRQLQCQCVLRKDDNKELKFEGIIGTPEVVESREITTSSGRA